MAFLSCMGLLYFSFDEWQLKKVYMKNEVRRMKKSEILLDFCLIPVLLIINFTLGGTLPAAVMLAIGIVLIVKGGDVFVDAATWIAEVSGIPKLIVGATVVSIATTLPELLVSAMAAGEGKVDMAIGNAIGSVTANLGLIMAIGIVCIPAAIKRKDYLLKSLLMLGSAVIIVIVGSFAKAGRIDGIGTVTSILLVIIFIIAMTDNVRSAIKAVKGGSEEKLGPESKTKAIIFSNIIKFILGALAIVFGADLLVDNGSIIASSLGISERVISVTIIAIGTSLPELVTTITAVIKKQSSLGVGNIIGANIMDLTFIMPVCNLISGKPLPVTESVAMIDFPACLIIGLAAVIPMLISKKFTRIQGGIMLLLYVVYMVVTVLGVDKLSSIF